jgi:predicted dehydrogenase
MTWRWLVVGCGSIGRRHLRNLRALGQTDLLVYRSRPVGVAEIEREFGARSFFSLEDALAQRPDAVLIANPTSLHVPAALQAAEAGHHLFIEKPVSHTLDGTGRLLALVEQRGLTAMVGYNLRFHPALHTLQEMVARGEIGDVLSVRAWAGQYLPDWHPGEDYRPGYVARADLGGGVILTLSHELDTLRWLLGDVDEVTAVVAQPSRLEMSTESVAEITLAFQGGVVAQVHLDCLQRTPSRGCEVIGSAGTIRCDLLRSEIQVLRAGAEPAVMPIAFDDPNQMYLDELVHFMDCIRTGQKPVVTLADGIAVLQIALAAHRAAETGVRQRCL